MFIFILIYVLKLMCRLHSWTAAAPPAAGAAEPRGAAPRLHAKSLPKLCSRGKINEYSLPHAWTAAPPAAGAAEPRGGAPCLHTKSLPKLCSRGKINEYSLPHAWTAAPPAAGAAEPRGGAPRPPHGGAGGGGGARQRDGWVRAGAATRALCFFLARSFLPCAFVSCALISFLPCAESPLPLGTVSRSIVR